MSALSFLREPGTERLLRRAAEAAGVPLSVHFVERNQEGTRVLGWGKCAACAHVAALPGGKLACRLSRQTAAGVAQRQQRPVAFVCHLGFGCMSVPLLPGEGFVLTLGPFAPAGEDQGLAEDVRLGLAGLDAPEEAQTPPLDDLHRVPHGMVPALVAWLLEDLHAAWAAYSADAVPEPDLTDDDADAPEGRARPGAARKSPYGSAEMAALLAGGEISEVRALLAGVLAETEAPATRRAATQRARLRAAVAAVLEAAERAGLPTGEAWAAFASLDGAGPEGLLDAGMRVLGVVGRRAAPRKAPATTYQALNAVLSERLLEGPTLGEVAQLLGETPSAISKRLSRNFGMSYSEYLGRLRIEKAKEYLRKGRLSATEIAGRVGISDQSNFGKLFRKFEGMTPLEYRERHGKKRR